MDMKKISLLILSGFIALSAYAGPLTGKWCFDAPRAPYDYNSGTVEFKDVNGVTTAIIDFGYSKCKIKELKETEKNIYKGNILIDGEEINLTLDNTNGKMKTSVHVPNIDMEIDVKLKKCNK